MLPASFEMQARARALARRAGVLTLGGVCLAIGAGFLLAALWQLVAGQFGPLAATCTLALLLIGAGLLVIRLAPPAPVMTPPAERLAGAAAQGQAARSTGQAGPLAEAFLFGASVALQIRARQRRH